MSLSAIIGLLITGFVVGAVARLIIPGRQRLGIVFTALLGVLGSLGGSLLLRATAPTAGAVLEFIVAVAVAAVLVLLVTAGRRSGRSASR